MKQNSFLLLFILVSNALMAQVDYYDITTHENVNVNKNVNVSGYVHQSQTVTTIDYGALALANAERERNRLEAQKYADEQSRRQALEIAANPLKAYDYGYPIRYTYKRNNDKMVAELGYKKVTQNWVFPIAFFSLVGFNELQNISEDGITTYFNLGFPNYIKNAEIEFYKALLETCDKGVEPGNFDISEYGDTTHYISQTKQIATVWGYQGKRNTLKWETEGQIGITDNYYVKTNYPINGFICLCKVRYYGDKSEVNWEQLEGRRYYLKKLVDKVIATASISDYEIVKEK